MSEEYAPREGSLPCRVIAHLGSLDAGSSITSIEVGQMFDCKGVSTMLRKAVDAGLLVANKVGSMLVYELPAPPTPPDGKLLIANYSDGDTMVQGGQQNEDGSITYTREQMQQLLAHLTVPHVALPAQPSV